MNCQIFSSLNFEFKGFEMAEITLKNNKISTIGSLPKIGEKSPKFLLTKTDLADITENDFSGKKIILNIFPSIDTAVCATSVRKFNEEASKLKDTVILCVSTDMPFALGRFCGSEGLKDVIPVSDFRKREFGENFGVRILNGPLAGVFSRAIIILDESRNVIYTEQVPEITQEPNYQEALNQIK
jgi:thioredoxin-dependent peroxiredoxin